MDDFPILMRFLRQRYGVSARQLSAESGLSLSYISKMEKGQVKPTVEAFAKIVNKLDISNAEIIYLIRNLGEGETD